MAIVSARSKKASTTVGAARSSGRAERAAAASGPCASTRATGSARSSNGRLQGAALAYRVGRSTVRAGVRARCGRDAEEIRTVLRKAGCREFSGADGGFALEGAQSGAGAMPFTGQQMIFQPASE